MPGWKTAGKTNLLIINKKCYLKTEKFASTSCCNIYFIPLTTVSKKWNVDIVNQSYEPKGIADESWNEQWMIYYDWNKNNKTTSVLMGDYCTKSSSHSPNHSRYIKANLKWSKFSSQLLHTISVVCPTPVMQKNDTQLLSFNVV